jgi:hypothetical protein
MHLLEKVIIYSVWVIGFVSLWFIPKNKYFEVSFIFLFAQLQTWIFGLIVVEFGLIQYPVRELSKANSTSFTFEYFIMPIMCIFFNLYFPDTKSTPLKILYYIECLLPFTLIELIVERYTLILKYTHWHGYLTFISMLIVFYIVRMVYKWFFKINKPLSPF